MYTSQLQLGVLKGRLSFTVSNSSRSSLPLQSIPASKMTRGDQRERAREKALKKKTTQVKGTSLPEGMTLAQKKEL